MLRRQCYTVEYKMHQFADVEQRSVLASSKQEAWQIVTFGQIPMPYSAWVSGVTYQNGNYKKFNNFEGKPY